MIEKCPEGTVWHLLSVIVNHECGSKVLKIARQSGITGGTILPARGTPGSRFSKWFDDYEVRKEIVLMISTEPLIDQVIEQLNRTMKFNKPNQGIALVFSVANLLGSAFCSMDKRPPSEGEFKGMQQAIFVIVDKGNAESVVQAAEKAGARGATVINGRGAGVHETSKLFAMEIEPEKEIVLIIAKREMIDAVTNAITVNLHLDEPGNGMLFVVDIQNSYGVNN